MNQKGFANIILIVIIIILVGAVGYFVFLKKSEPIAQQQTPTQTTAPTKTPVSTAPTQKDETADWQTYIYKNGENGYSFRYPDSWIIINGSGDSNIGNSPTIGLENKNVKNFDSIGYDIGLTSPTITVEDLAFYHKNSTTGINPNGPYASIDNFVASIKNSNNDKIFEEKNVVIAGNHFKRILRGYPNDQRYEYLINYPNDSLFVTISTPVTNKELNTGGKVDNIRITEKVLETFKFTR